MIAYNEYDYLKQVAVRRAEDAFSGDERLDAEWEKLRFHERPDMAGSIAEHDNFRAILESVGADVIELDGDDVLTLDSIYTRDNVLVSPKGLILCNMGRTSRTPEAVINTETYTAMGYEIAGVIKAPGTLEGGDFIWIDEKTAAVGLGPRTNQAGIDQLHNILGHDVDLHVVPLPNLGHPDDVLHLMSIISPIDKDLAVVYRPMMPDAFVNWLTGKGIKFVEVPEEEFLPMGCNVLAMGPRDALMLENLPGVQAGLEAAGCKVTTYKGMEISRKGEGGPTCLTRPLLRS